MPDASRAPPGAGRRAALPPGMEPRYLSREEAAAYLGVSLDTFLREVARGEWPPPRLRGAEGQRLTWDRRALDAAADQASGLLRLAGRGGNRDARRGRGRGDCGSAECPGR